MTPSTTPVPAPDGYADWLNQLKQDIAKAQQRAALAVNAELVLLYARIGRDILLRQEAQGWGAKVIDRLAHDLKDAFPAMRGWSASNLKYMRFFAQHCPEGLFGQQPADQLPWFHIVTLLTKLDSAGEREWYAVQTVQHGWSRTTLELNIRNRLHQRQGAAVSNFVARLPAPESALAQDTLKDPYLFDFLGLGNDAHEREIEDGLIRHITRFLLELGAGFAFVGRQVLLEVGDQDFYIDLLFYHLKLRCFVVIELKAVPFDPAFVGQTNLYLSAVDEQLRHPDDKPTLGLLLCRSKNKLVVEYALRGLKSPIGVADWETRLVDSLPEELKGSLPTIEQLEGELAARLSGSGEAAPNPTQRSPRQARARAEPPAALSAPERKPRGSKAKKQA